MYGVCMDEAVKPRNLHVFFKDPDELEQLKRLKGKREWRDWLMTLPDQFRQLTDRVELWKRRAEDFEKENTDLKERVRALQEQLGDV